jgi:Cu+-exporting ATPase
MTQQAVDLQIGGMTCASCAARIEKKLNRMPGVQASVNYATEKAHVLLPVGTDVQATIATIEATGYTARLPEPPARVARPSGGGGDDDSGVTSLRRRLLISALLTLPVFVLAMVPPLQFDNWQWLSLTLAAPVIVWGAWPFHQAALVNARHGAATMDTLISLGVLAAFGWSLYALFFGGAGTTGMTMMFTLFPDRGSGANDIYLEVAAAVTVFILAGRYFEARAKNRSGAALRALSEMGAKEVAVRRDGREIRIPIDQALYAEASRGDERVDVRQHAETFPGSGRDRRTDRMLGCLLQRAGQSQQFRLVNTGRGHHLDQPHPAGGDGAGLVQHDGVHPAGGFQHLRPLDQDAELRAAAGADQQRRRGGQPQRARAGDDQHGHRRGERDFRARSGGEPERQGRDREQDHDGHEDGGHPIR